MGAVRLFLALVVAADHLQATWLAPHYRLPIPRELKLGVNAGFAVMMFYVISGFLISTVLAQKYSASPGGTLAFYRSRFIRIFSLYWPLAIVVLAFWPGAWTRFAAASLPDQMTGLLLFGMDWRISFLPTTYTASLSALQVAWTLGAELTFYVLAPLLLRSWSLTIAVLTVSLAVRFYFVATIGYSSVWTYMFLPSTIAFFLLGHIGRVVAERFRRLESPSVWMPIFVLAFGALILGPPPEWDGVQFWTAIVCFALALPGLFELTKDNRFLNGLGGLSYPVYLIHYPVLVMLLGGSRLAGMFDSTGGSSTAIALLCVSVVTAAAVVVHWLIEQPTAAAMRWLSSPRLRKSLDIRRQVRPARQK